MPTLTALMGLAKPAGGSGGDVDTWGTIYLNGDMDLLDAHDHTTGKGAPVKSGALRIDGDVQWNYGGSYFAILQARALGLKPVAASSVAGDANVLYVDSGASNNLYFKNQGGAAVRITSGNNLDITLVGGIVGDYTAVNAEVAFDAGLDTYTFKQEGSPRSWAKMRCGDIDIYEAAATIANRIRLRSPAALAASYELVFPAALPSTTAHVRCSSTGTLTFSNDDSEPLVLPGLAIVATANNGYLSDGTTNAWAPTGATTGYLSVPLHTGDRITTVTLARYGDGVVDVTVTVYLTTAAGVVSSIGSATITNPAAAWGDTTIDVTDTTLAAGETISMVFVVNAANARIGNVRVTHTRPA